MNTAIAPQSIETARRVMHDCTTKLNEIDTRLIEIDAKRAELVASQGEEQERYDRAREALIAMHATEKPAPAPAAALMMEPLSLNGPLS